VVTRGEPGGGGQQGVDNTTINSLTVTIVSVSMVSLALVAALLYLVYFTVHRRRLSSPFRHRRMTEREGQSRTNNMEFANRMFLQDEMEDEEETLTMEELEPSRNFVNPVYETMFQESSGPIIKTTASLPPESEQTGLLRSDSATPPPGRAVIHTDSD